MCSTISSKTIEERLDLLYSQSAAKTKGPGTQEPQDGILDWRPASMTQSSQPPLAKKARHRLKQDTPLRVVDEEAIARIKSRDDDQQVNKIFAEMGDLDILALSPVVHASCARSRQFDPALQKTSFAAAFKIAELTRKPIEDDEESSGLEDSTDEEDEMMEAESPPPAPEVGVPGGTVCEPLPDEIPVATSMPPIKKTDATTPPNKTTDSTTPPTLTTDSTTPPTITTASTTQVVITTSQIETETSTVKSEEHELQQHVDGAIESVLPDQVVGAQEPPSSSYDRRPYDLDSSSRHDGPFRKKRSEPRDSPPHDERRDFRSERRDSRDERRDGRNERRDYRSGRGDYHHRQLSRDQRSETHEKWGSNGKESRRSSYDHHYSSSRRSRSSGRDHSGRDRGMAISITDHTSSRRSGSPARDYSGHNGRTRRSSDYHEQQRRSRSPHHRRRSFSHMNPEKDLPPVPPRQQRSSFQHAVESNSLSSMPMASSSKLARSPSLMAVPSTSASPSLGVAMESPNVGHSNQSVQVQQSSKWKDAVKLKRLADKMKKEAPLSEGWCKKQELYMTAGLKFLEASEMYSCVHSLQNTASYFTNIIQIYKNAGCRYITSIGYECCAAALYRATQVKRKDFTFQSNQLLALIKAHQSKSTTTTPGESQQEPLTLTPKLLESLASYLRHSKSAWEFMDDWDRAKEFRPDAATLQANNLEVLDTLDDFDMARFMTHVRRALSSSFTS